jgi:hypothetical protein
LFRPRVAAALALFRPRVVVAVAYVSTPPTFRRRLRLALRPWPCPVCAPAVLAVAAASVQRVQRGRGWMAVTPRHRPRPARRAALSALPAPGVVVAAEETRPPVAPIPLLHAPVGGRRHGLTASSAWASPSWRERVEPSPFAVRRSAVPPLGRAAARRWPGTRLGATSGLA